jgi:hypothetical protein
MAQVDQADRENIGGDPVLHVANHACGLDAGPKMLPAEQQPAAHPHPGLDHEEGHEEGQQDLEDHRGGGERDLLEHRGAGDDDLPLVLPEQLRELVVEGRDPGEVVAQLAEVFADPGKHRRHLVEQPDRRTEHGGERENHDR